VDINATFQQQHGVITRAQAIALGLSARQIGYRLETGQWIAVQPSIYRPASTAESWEMQLLAACLSTGGIASHRNAAALWNLDLYSQPPIEISVERGRSVRRDIARVHETTQWDRRDPITIRGIPCTGIERTILDCAAKVGPRRAERLAEAAIRQNKTSWLALADCLKDHSRQGRDGCLTLRNLLDVRLGNGTVPLSDFSRRVVNLLVDAGIPHPHVEYRIADSDGSHILQVDLAWPDRRKAWELDGLAFHFGRHDIERDRRKRNRLISEGWVIQEILWSMYVDDPGGLVRMARKFLFKT